MEATRWAILGCGGIAGKFARSLAAVSDGELVACASRTRGKARAFAEEHGARRWYERYEDLVADGEVDAVYVANTHNFHCETALLAMRAGKAVLCEKPLAPTAAEARQMVDCSRESGVFLMEAMWTRFLPAVRQGLSWIREGRIGEVKLVQADFGVRFPWDPEARIFNPDLAGGVLWDLGVYPVSLVSAIMGEQPETLCSLAHRGETGVDEQSACLFRYGGGALAVLSVSGISESTTRAEISGTRGKVIFPEKFLNAQEVELQEENGARRRLRLPFAEAEGFRFEIEAVHASLGEGALESTLMPQAESLAIAGTVDRIRACWD